jgi:hypothetical protein
MVSRRQLKIGALYSFLGEITISILSNIIKLATKDKDRLIILYKKIKRGF